MIRLSKTNIEYGDLAWNFYPGCNRLCSYCWAQKSLKRMACERCKSGKPHLHPERILRPMFEKKPSRILVNFTGDLFGDWVDPEQKEILHGFDADGSSYDNSTLKNLVYYVIESCPQHTFIFLTKFPQNLAKFSPFPDNCWVGVTTTDYWKYVDACHYLSQIEAKVKYISLEPLLSWDNETSSYFFESGGINWLIIGAQTNPTVLPRIEWVQEIVKAADTAGVKVFLKNNLEPLLRGHNLNDLKGLIETPKGEGGNFTWKLRQEVP